MKQHKVYQYFDYHCVGVACFNTKQEADDFLEKKNAETANMPFTHFCYKYEEESSEE